MLEIFSSYKKETIATATISFLFGWAFKKYNIGTLLKNIRNIKNLGNVSDDMKMIVVVRSDLPMTKGKIAAQCCHAALGCYRKGLTISPHKVKLWELKNEAKVILKTNSGEVGLRRLADRANDAGLVTVLIRDAGRTQISSGTATVLGIGPDSVEKINKITSDLKLM